MAESRVSRRNFSKLAVAAAGGMFAGSRVAGAQEGSEGKENGEFPVDAALLLAEPNVCRGLNSCEGHGKNAADHACAGQSACSTVAEHSCHGTNECKGQGGCGAYPGQNTCQGKGHCAVPLSEKTWSTARKQFEHLMKDMGKEFGNPPAA